MELERQLDRTLARSDVSAAVAYARDHDEATLATQVELSEIAAPPFGEGERAGRMLEILRETGLDARLDPVGNVVAVRPGSTDGVPLVVSAHLDTVFPAGTDVRVTRDGTLLRGPGISDDARGLAALVTLARMLADSGIETRVPVLFAATVGEEGDGDLRGVKGLFGTGGAATSAGGFISLDGAGLSRIVVDGLGARRYRIGVRGPGGHSWVDWGAPNPLHVLVALGCDLLQIPLETEPRTTLTLARVGGGKSINAIPEVAWLDVDTRSASSEALASLETEVRTAVRRHAATHRGVDLDVRVVGDRPGGKTDRTSTLVRAAVAATRRLEREPVLATSSTDANIPMAAGIPAVTLGCGGEAGKAHTTDEWYRNVRGVDGIVRALYTILLTAGLDTPGP